MSVFQFPMSEFKLKCGGGGLSENYICASTISWWSGGLGRGQKKASSARTLSAGGGVPLLMPINIPRAAVSAQR